MEINFEELKREFSNRANEIYKDNEKLEELIDEFTKKIKNNKIVGSVGNDIKLALDMIMDWRSGQYTKLSKDSIILIFVGILYILSPISIIPNSSSLKYLDDILVLAYIIKKIKNELETYKKWKGEDLSFNFEVEETTYIDLT